MTAAYGGVSFEIPSDGNEETLPLPDPGEVEVFRQHIPGTNIDFIQFPGKGSEPLVLVIELQSAGALNALKALELDGTARDLTGYPVIGGTITLAGMLLIRLRNPRRFYRSYVNATNPTEVVRVQAEWWRQSTTS